MNPLKHLSLREQARNVADAGSGGDTVALHVNKSELPAFDALGRALGGAGTINHRTGLRQYHGGGMNGGASGHGNDRASNRNANSGRPATGHQAAITQAATGQNLTKAGQDTDNFREASPGGGTYTSYEYTPGAVENFPDANFGAVLDNVFTTATPILGALNGLSKVYNTVAGGDLSKPVNGVVGDAFGADPGPQRGWAPERDHGMANGIGGASDGNQFVASKSPLRALRMVPTQNADAYQALLQSLSNPKVYSSSDAVIVR